MQGNYSNENKYSVAYEFGMASREGQGERIKNVFCVINDIFTIIVKMIVSQVYICVKTYKSVYFKCFY